MHGSVGLHSALAIKRQRRLREQRRRMERSFSSPKGSIHSFSDKHRKSNNRHVSTDTGIASNIGMMHLGVVFIIIGVILLGSGMLPDNYTRTLKSGSWINELMSSGIFAIILGLFLLAVNRFVSEKEDEKLNEYVQNQLSRTRSGRRLERDHVTGGMKIHEQRDDLKKHSIVDNSNNIPIPHSPILKNISDESGHVNGNHSMFTPITSETIVLLDN